MIYSRNRSFINYLTSVHVSLINYISLKNNNKKVFKQFQYSLIERNC